jgi:2-methylcitrate dehydratase PrpD
VSVDATTPALAGLAQFVITCSPPAEARRRAAIAFLDTIGVMLAGAVEPASRSVQAVVAAGSSGRCLVAGTRVRADAPAAALANGTAAHALDFDDMCFVSLAHPSAPLVPAALAAAELVRASGRHVLDAYVAGFELEARLGQTMNPRHYQRGWHCTSTLGTLGAAAAASRVMGLDADSCRHALGIAASQASGLKENFGTMVKPLHAGLAARNGVLAAQLAANGLTASDAAVDGPQGLLHAMDSERRDLPTLSADLGRRWEIVDTGIAVKLYPSCAATHPPLDAILDLRREHDLSADAIERIDIDVDAITPTVLIHDEPASGLEGKFSLPYCAAAAVVFGHVAIETFEATILGDPRVRAMMRRVRMQVDPALGAAAPPLTQARVRLTLRDGRTLTRQANGARGYPDRPASDAELDAKFSSCAARVLSPPRAATLLGQLRDFEQMTDVRTLTRLLTGD